MNAPKSKLAHLGSDELVALVLKHGGRVHAARELGVSESAVRRRLAALGVDNSELNESLLKVGHKRGGPSPSKASQISAETARELLLKHGSIKAVVKHLGTTYFTLSRRLDELGIDSEERATLRKLHSMEARRGLVQREESEDGEQVTVVGAQTLEEAVALAQVDQDVWKVKDWSSKPWGAIGAADPETGQNQRFVLVSTSVKYVLREFDDPEAMARRWEDRLDRVAKRSPRVRKIRPAREAGSLIVEPSIYDFHLGMLADAKETGEEVTLETAKALWRAAVDLIIQKLPPKREIDRIVFPFGNDMAHINDRWGSTGNGTPQDRAAMLHQIAEAMESLLVETFDALKEIAPVEAICVPGNHGPDVELFVARYLDAWFRNDANVTVDAGRNPYKFRRWDNTCIGWTHLKGRGRRIPSKDLCGQFHTFSQGLSHGARWMEWHVGHEHHKEVEEHFGVRMRMVPSLVASDSWHHHSAYGGAQRMAEVFLWDRRYGEAGKVPVSLLEIRDAAGLSCAA